MKYPFCGSEIGYYIMDNVVWFEFEKCSAEEILCR